MFLETRKEKALAYQWSSPRRVEITRCLDVFRCDHCGHEHTTLRLDGEDRPSVPFYCRRCNQLVSVN